MDELEEFKLSKKTREKLKDKATLKKELAAGKTVQEILGFSNGTMEKLFESALQLLEHKRYIDAANAFLFLAILNPHSVDYWMSLGTAAQYCHDYEGALDAYEMAAYERIDNPVPYFYLAKCLFALHDRDSTLQALDLAIEYSGDSDEYSELRHQAQEAKALLLKTEHEENEE